jgi:hypothetical protein
MTCARPRYVADLKYRHSFLGGARAREHIAVTAIAANSAARRHCSKLFVLEVFRLH